MGVFEIKIGGRSWPQGSRQKLGVYQASLSGGKVYKTKSARLYLEGSCDANRLKDEVIPKVKEYIRSGHKIKLPVAVECYVSKRPSLGDWRGGARRVPDSKSRRLKFFVNEGYAAFEVAEDGTLLDPI